MVGCIPKKLYAIDRGIDLFISVKFMTAQTSLKLVNFSRLRFPNPEIADWT